MLKKIFILAISVYQKTISPDQGFFIRRATCRFQPTCSEYCRQALMTLPWPQALFFSAKRIWRCRPWGGAGYDPVPARIKK
ncbi:MAG: membrane protein insertion efficiency factor YidD [Candidatus Portnoybacteria bacterium CG10_big_fil_rev_8_21_14_0_10_44_7]|uniref:Putative membrane protein insertion efficiency factor n=1 Tax=Candidatus Portnoybacteria bacterium CG10_big_fil_rev_8_21_14_0_10_44_7 TaxID=1974816 RepID=A0A2M8KIS4_9BACT|nr:MAG: membrane protein insertion efficiency factor YidD [Candidatus Portnoybacteria bacterium CG10_big_fil_rev_8_21_14_0_10_44_7]